MFDFSAFPGLTTERLVLRELASSDATDVFQFRSDSEVQLYNSEPMTDVSEAYRFIEQVRASYDAQQEIVWAVALADAERVVGLVSLYHWNRYHCRATVGYDLARAYWGRGMASESMRGVIRFGFERMGLHRIEATTIVDNVRSVRLLERLGFRREGTRREYSYEEDGMFHHSAIYGLLQHEFQAENL